MRPDQRKRYLVLLKATMILRGRLSRRYCLEDMNKFVAAKEQLRVLELDAAKAT